MKNWILACSVCFGDPSSNLSRGAFWGASFLAGVVSLVLASIAWTILVWSRRSHKT